MRKYLTEDILTFWLKHGLDTECGGIVTQLDRQGNPYGYEKNVWFMGRAMYTFSHAYNTVEKRPEYLEFAANMLDFFPKCDDGSGRLPFIVNREGRPIVVNDDYFSETFACIGCAEFYLATGREDARMWAERYFDVAYGLYKKSLLRPDDPSAPEPISKPLGPPMILLSTAQTMRKLDRKKYHPIALECAEEILRHKTDMGLLENVTMSGGFIDTPSGRLINPGHSLEAGWFLMAEGIYRDDARLIREAREIIDRALELGYRDGGIIAFCDCKGLPPSALEWDMKIWWPQCEALIATRLCYETLGEQKYLDLFATLKDYVFSRYPDKEYGEWYGYLHYDGTVANSLKGNYSKGPFHLPRMLMLLDRMDRGIPLLD